MNKLANTIFFSHLGLFDSKVGKLDISSYLLSWVKLDCFSPGDPPIHASPRRLRYTQGWVCLSNTETRSFESHFFPQAFHTWSHSSPPHPQTHEDTVPADPSQMLPTPIQALFGKKRCKKKNKTTTLITCSFPVSVWSFFLCFISLSFPYFSISYYLLHGYMQIEIFERKR